MCKHVGIVGLLVLHVGQNLRDGQHKGSYEGSAESHRACGRLSKGSTLVGPWLIKQGPKLGSFFLTTHHRFAFRIETLETFKAVANTLRAPGFGKKGAMHYTHPKRRNTSKKGVTNVITKLRRCAPGDIETSSRSPG